MVSLISRLLAPRDAAPVPFTGQRSGAFPTVNGASVQGQARDTTAQMGAMTATGTVFQIVSRKASALSMVDWHLYRRPQGTSAARSQPRRGMHEERQEVTSHAALSVWNRPNAFMSRQQLVETIAQHQCLVGESFLAPGFDPRLTSPIELWPVNPARIEVVPDKDEYLKGYVYRAPDGTRVPIPRDQAVFMRAPNPLDPYRGLGPIQSILVDLDSDRYSSEWNRNFFVNGAAPGGVVELNEGLSDTEWDEMNRRWAESHRGYGNAHRVAFLEHGTYKDSSFTQRDMQFAELRGVTRDVIREAFGFSKTMMGQTEDVNRATAEAAEYVFAKWQLIGDLERLKGALNNQFLPMFGPETPQLVEFDYDSPVTQDEAAELAEEVAKVGSAVQLVNAGFDPEATLAAFCLPPIPFIGKAAQNAQA